MDEIESKIGAILENPEMMQKIMSLAQSFQQPASSEQPAEAVCAQEAPASPQGYSSPPELDLSMLQKLSGFTKQSSIDKRQQTLLNALNPYLSPHRITKLEKAMRAAKMASMASVLLGKNQLITGR